MLNPIAFRRSLPNLFAFGICLTLLAVAARADEAKEAEKKITFDDHILPIFRQRCGSCHNGNDKKGGLILDNYVGMMEGGGSGSVIEIGDASASYLYMVVTHDSEPVMPPNQPKMPDEELALIQQWIDLGALENKGSKVVKKASNLAKIEISTARPADAPVLPQNVSVSPVVTSDDPNSITALANSPWASLAAVSGQNQVLLYSTETGLLTGVLPFPEGMPQILKFSRNGQLLLAGGGRGGASGKVIIFDIKTGNRVAELGNEYDAVLAADISADHTQVVLAGPKRMIRVYAVQTGELMYEIKKHTDWILAAEFSPDGVLLCTADRSNGMFLWEALTGNEYLTLKGHTGAITDVSWRPDSNIVGSCSEDGTIRFWELNDGREVKKWNAHGGGVSAIDFTRNVQIVSIGRDKVVKLWDAEGQNLKSYGGLQDLGLEVAYDAELNRVLGGDWNGEVRVWDSESTSHLFSLAANPPGISEQLAVTEQKLTQLQQEFASVDAQTEAINKQISARKTQLEGVRTALAETQKQAQLKQAELTQFNQQYQTAQKLTADLQQQFNTHQQQLQEELGVLPALEKTVTDLNNQLKVATDTKAATDNNIQQLTGQIAELQKQGESAQEALQKAQAELAGLQAESANQAKAVTETQAQLAAAQQLVANQKAMIAKTTETRDAVNNQLQKSVVDAKAIETQVQAITKAQADFAQKIQTIQQQITDLEPKLPPTADEQKKLAELGAQKSGRQGLMNSLQAHLEMLKKQIAGSAQASVN